MRKKISNYQVVKYAVLTTLSESGEGKTMDELVYLTNFDKKHLLNVVSRLITWRDIKSIKSEKGGPKIYRINNQGRQKQRYFKEIMGLGRFWVPSWEENQ